MVVGLAKQCSMYYHCKHSPLPTSNGWPKGYTPSRQKDGVREIYHESYQVEINILVVHVNKSKQTQHQQAARRHRKAG